MEPTKSQFIRHFLEAPKIAFVESKLYRVKCNLNIKLRNRRKNIRKVYIQDKKLFTTIEY